jgi:hypothetical protein
MFRAFGVERNTASVEWTGETASQGTVLVAATPAPGAAEEVDGDESGVGVGYGGASFRSPTTARAARRAPAGGGVFGDDLSPGAATAATEAPAPAAMTRDRASLNEFARGRARTPARNWGWMRRVWVRRASIANTPQTLADQALDPAFVQRAARAREALTANPDSRDRHRELLKWLALGGDVDEADTLARRWLARDPLDADAITRTADVAARSGDRARSLRVLSGVLDVRADDVSSLERMAIAYERLGDGEQACAYRVSIAEVRPGDASAVARAVRCLRGAGRSASALRVVNAIGDASLRIRVEAEAGTPPVSNEGDVRGDLIINATWDGADDLDVAVIDPRGVRLSWQGGRANITARQVTSRGAESLGLPRLSTGEHVIEVTRAAPGRGVVQGHVTLRVLGQTRTVPFVLSDEGVRVARVNITRESQLVPVDR